MKKKLLIFFIFFSLFLVNPKPIRAEENFFTTLANLFLQLFGLTQSTTKDYVPATVDNRQDNTKFNSDHNDISTRAAPASIKAYNTGVWLHEIVTKKTDPDTNKILYEDLNIKAIENSNCNDMKLSDIVYFYQQKFNSGQLSEKILYQRGNLAPINYPSDLESLKNKSITNPDNCYINAYLNLHSIPRQDFDKGGSSNDLDGVTLSSNQLNDTTKLSIPYDLQGETIPAESNSITAKTIAKNTDIQDRNSLLNIIPKEYQDLIPCGETTTENRKYLFTAKNCLNTPAGWGAKECSSFSDTKQLDIDIDCDDFDGPKKPNGEKYKGGSGPGMSQLGGHGMALSGFTTNQILTSYLGDVDVSLYDEHNELNPKDESLKVSVFMETDYGGQGFSCKNVEGATSYEPDLTNGTGGFKKDGDNIVECTNDDYDKEEIEIIDPTTGEKTIQTTYKQKNPPLCFIFVKDIPMQRYLQGVAETSRDWHIEYQKAHMLICRQAAISGMKNDRKAIGQGGNLGPWIYNNSNNQAFRCDDTRDLDTNQGIAIQKTNGERIINKTTKLWADDSTQERSFFCEPNSTTGFDGYKYEKISHAYSHKIYLPNPNNTNTNTNNSQKIRINGICFEGVSNDTNVLGVTSDTSTSTPKITRQPTKRSSSVTASLINGLYSFNDSSRQNRIKENYDLVDVDEGKWLATYPDQTSCRLDSRVIPALTSLINTISQEIPDNQLIPQNCYRDFDTQYQLWQQGLNKYQDLYTNLIWHSYPGTSIHQTGRVIDFYDKSGQLDKNSPVYQWLVQNGSRFGFYHHPIEPWHWEYNP